LADIDIAKGKWRQEKVRDACLAASDAGKKLRP
jgi:hypothetical protein